MIESAPAAIASQVYNKGVLVQYFLAAAGSCMLNHFDMVICSLHCALVSSEGLNVAPV